MSKSQYLRHAKKIALLVAFLAAILAAHVRMGRTFVLAPTPVPEWYPEGGEIRVDQLPSPNPVLANQNCHGALYFQLLGENNDEENMLPGTYVVWESNYPDNVSLQRWKLPEDYGEEYDEFTSVVGEFCEFDANFSTPGTYHIVITATAHGFPLDWPNPITDTYEFDLTVVGVGSLSYASGGSWVAIPGTGPLYVLKGTTVRFRATAAPTGASWPAGKPAWTGATAVTGTPSEADVTFNVLSTSATNYKVVSAEAGNTKLVNVVVFDIEPDIVATTNGWWRIFAKFGLRETATTSCTISPSGLSVATIGGLEWKTDAAVTTDSIVDNHDGTGLYTCGTAPGNPLVRLVVSSGPSKDQEKTIELDVIAPSGVGFAQESGTNLGHINGVASVGFRAHAFLAPNDVSFENIAVAEDFCTAVCDNPFAAPPTGHSSGYYSAFNPATTLHVGTGFWIPISNAPNNEVAGEDSISSGELPAPYSDGRFTLPIPWMYSATETPGGPRTNPGTAATHPGDGTQFDTANQVETMNGVGTVSISKTGSAGGAGPFTRAVGDNNSGYVAKGGTIRDGAGQPVSGVTVTIVIVRGGVTVQTEPKTTGIDGKYYITNLVEGDFTTTPTQPTKTFSPATITGSIGQATGDDLDDDFTRN